METNTDLDSFLAYFDGEPYGDACLAIGEWWDATNGDEMPDERYAALMVALRETADMT